jgi:hypothetical protein
MPIESWLVLAGLSRSQLIELVHRLPVSAPRGRPHARSLIHRVLLTCVALRSNLTLRELAAVAGIPRSTVHRIVSSLTPRLAATMTTLHDRRAAWVLDGTLVPTRDHRRAAKSKNYRWSCNAQLLVRRRDLAIVAAFAGGPGNRNDPIHYRGSPIEALCRAHRRVLADGGYRGIEELRTPRFRRGRIVRDRRWRRHRRRRARVEHAIARLKNWRVLRDHRRQGRHLDETFRAVCALHNLQVELRDNP